MKDPSDKTQGPIQQAFPVKSVGVRSTKIIHNQTLLISVNLSQKIILEVLRQGLLVPCTMICVRDFAHGPSTKCPEFSEDASMQLKAKTALASLLSKYFLPFLLKKDY